VRDEALWTTARLEGSWFWRAWKRGRFGSVEIDR
jgi:hypothetical protein